MSKGSSSVALHSRFNRYNMNLKTKAIDKILNIQESDDDLITKTKFDASFNDLLS